MDKISCAFCHLASCKMFKASPAKTVMREFFFHLLSRIFVHLLSLQIRCALSSAELLSQLMGFPLLSNASSNASMTHGHLPTNRCSPAHCTQLVSAIQAAVQKELPAVSWTYIPRPMPPFPDIWQLKVTLILLQVLMLTSMGNSQLCSNTMISNANFVGTNRLTGSFASGYKHVGMEYWFKHTKNWNKNCTCVDARTVALIKDCHNAVVTPAMQS